MNFTLIDPTGEIVSTVSVPDDDHLAANTPAGTTAIEGDSPGVACYYKDGAWVVKPERPDEFHVWDAATKTWDDTRTIEQLREARWQEIKASREAVINSTFAWDGSVFDCDPTSQVRIQGGVLDAMVAVQQSQPFSVAWTLADNTVRALSATDMVQVGLAMAMAIRDNFSRGQMLRSSINAATTAAQLESIQWD